MNKKMEDIDFEKRNKIDRSKNSLLNKTIVFYFENGYRIVGNNFLNPNGKKLKICKNSKGYSVCGIYNRKIKKNFLLEIHRFAGYQKYGNKIFNKKYVVMHLDNDKTNFNLDNLKLGTQSENIMQIPIEVRHEKAVKAGEASAKVVRKFSDKIVRKIFIDRKNNMSYSDISKKYNIFNRTVYKILNETKYTQQLREEFFNV